ncbi:MAG: Na-translocating system protein MpsC family protein [Acidaminococcales bacterium]|jgi:hypothetical protein|nr:Na-translocating system protein MpsC family protein [Acidaminococcales bacterium]
MNVDALSGAELKKKLFRIYNEVNKDIYGFGVVEIKIDMTPDFIMFFGKHNRVHALRVLEKRYIVLKQSVDQALFQEFKLLLRQKLNEELELYPAAILRDYETNSQIAVTVVVLRNNL